METILFLAHSEADGLLGKAALEVLTVAKELGESLGGGAFHAGLVGACVSDAAAQIGSCGAKRFLSVAGPDFAEPRYATDALAAEALAKAVQATVIVAPATSRWARVLAGVAQRLGGRVDSHVAGLSLAGGQLQITRWYYKQRMEAAITRVQRPWVLLVDPGSQPSWQGAKAEVPLETVPVSIPETCKRTAVVRIQSPAAEAQTIRPEASLLFVTGAGWTKKQADGQPHVAEAEKLIWEFLQTSRASLGSTKSLVDLGGEGQAVLSFLTHLNQVGQTGSTPRHPKGLATCCHGEEPHTVGWRFIHERRAVNLDPNCGWARSKADVLYVADAFAVISKLTALLATKK